MPWGGPAGRCGARGSGCSRRGLAPFGAHAGARRTTLEDPRPRAQTRSATSGDIQAAPSASVGGLAGTRRRRSRESLPETRPCCASAARTGDPGMTGDEPAHGRGPSWRGGSLLPRTQHAHAWREYSLERRCQKPPFHNNILKNNDVNNPLLNKKR